MSSIVIFLLEHLDAEHRPLAFDVNGGWTRKRTLNPFDRNWQIAVGFRLGRLGGGRPGIGHRGGPGNRLLRGRGDSRRKHEDDERDQHGCTLGRRLGGGGFVVPEGGMPSG